MPTRFLFNSCYLCFIRLSFSDLAGRLLAVIAGVGTIYLTYLIGKNMYGRVIGSLAALFLAFMPYHVLVSRQFLLDGPMVFFATLTIYALVRFARSQKICLAHRSRLKYGFDISIKGNEHCPPRCHICILCSHPGNSGKDQRYAPGITGLRLGSVTVSLIPDALFRWFIDWIKLFDLAVI